MSRLQDFSSGRNILEAQFNTEGTGDNVYDVFRDIYWSGYVDNPSCPIAGGRSDIKFHEELEQITGVKVIGIAVRKPFFHIDTTMAPLSRGHIMVYKDGMSKEAFQKLKYEGFKSYGMDVDDYLIQVNRQDALRYACNVRYIGNTVIMPQVSVDLQEKLHSKGYEVICLDVSRFIDDGGAMHCLTNNINEQRVQGGTCAGYGYSLVR